MGHETDDHRKKRGLDPSAVHGGADRMQPESGWGWDSRNAGGDRNSRSSGRDGHTRSSRGGRNAGDNGNTGK